MGMILRIASSRIVGQGDIVGRSGYFSLNLSANSVMRGRLDARRTLKSLVADLRFIHPRLPFGHRRLCGERTCKQHRSQTKYKSTFHVSIHFSYSSLTFTTRTGWVAGTNPDFNIIRCPRSEARKEANPHGSALRGSFNKA